MSGYGSPRDENGQALVEFAASTLAMASLVAGVFMVFDSIWHKVQCSHAVFERTHERLVSDESDPVWTRSLPSWPGARIQVRFEESESTVAGEARCGKTLHRIEFIRLQAMH